MTMPAQPQQTPPPQDQVAAAAVSAAAVAAVMAALELATVAAALKALAGMIIFAGIPRRALYASLDIAMSHPPGQTGFYGPATMAMERANRQSRAMFVLTAARRIGDDLRTAHSRGTSQIQALRDAAVRERRYYAQHLVAIWGRSQAGAQTDSAAMTYGNLLGWHTVRDARTSRECLMADGKNFLADHVPLIGYPGAVHPNCRCRPGAPFPGGRLLPSHGIPDTSRYRRAA